MKIELKNVKYAEFASEETNCFEATVYVDGVRAFTASNDGHGGCNDYHPVSTQGRELLAKAEQYAKSLPPMKCEEIPEGLPMDLDLVIGDLFDEWLTNKEIKRLSKNCTLFLLPTDDPKQGYRTVGNKTTTRAQEIAFIKAKYPEATIILPK